MVCLRAQSWALLPLGHIFCKSDINVHFYADDTHLSSKPNTIFLSLAGFSEIKSWFSWNFIVRNWDPILPFRLRVWVSSWQYFTVVNNTTWSAYNHLQNININVPWPSLTANITAVLEHALVTSRIDYCKSLLSQWCFTKASSKSSDGPEFISPDLFIIPSASSCSKYRVQFNQIFLFTLHNLRA